ncbi:MAG: pilus assembly protein [Actinobacteria bacterium]|nr:pilus assembly protein [Actinomycetota bacterium]
MRRPVFFKNLFRATGGQATLEFVFVVPVIIAVLLVVAQSGHMIYRKNILQQAAREGVRVISVTNSNQQAIQAVVRACGTGENETPDIRIFPGGEGKRKIGDIVTVSLIESSSDGGLLNIISGILGRKIFIKAESSMRMECQEKWK